MQRASPSPVLLAQDNLSPVAGHTIYGGKTVAIRLGPVELGLWPIEIRLGPT